MSDLPANSTPASDPAPTTPEGSLLEHALANGAPARERRVFVNRALRLEKIRFVGFDLDWTLAPYYRLPLEELTFTLALERLVERYGYPERSLEAEFRPHFPHRGLIVDREEGTVLKMNRHRYVGRAYLGRRPLSHQERAERYRRDPIELQSPRYYRVDTLFELAEVNLFTELVELRSQSPEGFPDDYDALFTDVRSAVDLIHADGTLKHRMLADLQRYLRRDRELGLALLRLKLGGRRLFVVTNSEWFFSEAILAHILDDLVPGISSWREYFDLVVVSAQKPAFFRRRRDFEHLDERGEVIGTEAVPRWGEVYAGGSREGLMDLFQGLGEEVLYVGDHIYGDVVSSKLTSAWRTALIIREVEDEVQKLGRLAQQVRHLDAVKGELSELGQRMDDLRDILTLYEREASGISAELVTTTRTSLGELEDQHRALRNRAAELQRRISHRMSPTWGSVFKQGGSMSLFGSQIDDFACLYTSRVSNFAHYGSNHYFRVLRDPMVHEHDLW